MKIAAVDLLFNWPPDGGARTDVKEVLTRLNKKHDVKLFAPDMDFIFPRGRGAENTGIDTVKIKTSPFDFNSRTFPEKLKKEIDNFNPDIIFFTDGWYMKWAVINRFLNYRYVIRFYAYEGLCLKQHGVFFKKEELCCENYLTKGFWTWLKCFFCTVKWFIISKSKVFLQEFIFSGAFMPSYKKKVIESLKRANAVICYNEFIKQKILPFNKNVHIVPSGVDLNNFKFINDKKIDLKQEKEVYVLMTGRYSDGTKGFHILKKAADILKKDYKLILMATRDTVYDEKAENIIIYEWLTQEKLPELYKKAHICVVPSIWPEPFGIVALEAMASGTPVIVSKTGGLQTIVEDNVSGLVFEPGNFNELAAKIKELIESPILYEKLRTNALKRVKEKYAWDKIARDIKAVLITNYSGTH